MLLSFPPSDGTLDPSFPSPSLHLVIRYFKCNTTVLPSVRLGQIVAIEVRIRGANAGVGVDVNDPCKVKFGHIVRIPPGGDRWR